MQKKVLILMSTYNGEKYLNEQLDSLVALVGVSNIKISIRDDGSTDSTRKTLDAYSKKYGFDVVYGNNIGVNACMMELIKGSDESFDYFAFCDQDDIWSANKIKLAIDAMENENQDIPLLWGCCEELVDASLAHLDMMPTPKYLGVFYNSMVQNTLPGHVQIFNKKLRDLLICVPTDKMLMYDWVNYIIASAMGKVLYESTTCGKYRQHERNLIGFNTSRKRFANYISRIKKGVYRDISKQIECVHDTFKDVFPKEYSNELYRFLKYRKNIFLRGYYISITKVLRNSQRELINFKILYFLGFY